MAHTKAKPRKGGAYGGEGYERNLKGKPPRQPDSSPKKPGDSPKDHSPPDFGQSVESG